MPTIPVLQFNGGMTSDARNSGSFSQLCKHFDNFTKSHSLIPYKDSESAYASQATDKLQSFLIFSGINNPATAGYLYALGVMSGQNYAKIFQASDIGSPTFTASSGGADSGGTTDFRLFFEYHGVLYGGSATSRIWSYNVNTASFSATTGGGNLMSYTNLCQGIVHSKDDRGYFGADNKVYYKDGTSDIALGLTLPSNLVVTSLCEEGNYLAIGCRPLFSNAANSKMFLWDRDSTLTTLSESVDWGNRDLYAIENIDGYIVGVSIQTAYSSAFTTKLVFSQYSGGTSPIVFREILLSTASASVVIGKQKVNNRMYIGVTATSMGGTTNDLTGIWSVGRNGQSQPFSVQMDRLPNNDTVATQMKGFYLIQDFMYISSLDASSAYQLTKTNDQNFYTATAIYRTVINPNMRDEDKIQNKTLVSVSLTYEPIIAGTQCVLKYRVDGSAFTTIFTENGTNAKSTKFTLASGTAFTDGEDYDFQIESQGVTVTGFFYEYRIKTT